MSPLPQLTIRYGGPRVRVGRRLVTAATVNTAATPQCWLGCEALRAAECRAGRATTDSRQITAAQRQHGQARSAARQAAVTIFII